MRSFDTLVTEYEEQVARSISFMPAAHAVYLEIKARHLARVATRVVEPRRSRVLDIGCGVGLVDSLLRGVFESVEGVDPSAASLEEARDRNPWASYRLADGASLPYPDGNFDVTFTMCVLHHVAPSARRAFVHEMLRVTRPGGVAALYEHNPLNPLTRVAVGRCEFDRDAVLLRPREIHHLLADAEARPPFGTDYLVFFPWRGRHLRALERRLTRFPAGAQYAVVAHA